MKTFGFSLYPKHQSAQENRSLIEKAAKAGLKTIFTCMISLDNEDDIAALQDLSSFAHNHGMKLFADVDASVFDRLQLPFDDLSFFEGLGLDGVRIDFGFTPEQIALLSRNPQKMAVEVNASMSEGLKPLLAHNPDLNQLQACHNFYPQKYTGLSKEFFSNSNAPLQKAGIPVIAFAGSLNPEAKGPWEVLEGLTTLEEHRSAPLARQILDFLEDPAIKEIRLSNSPLLDEEFDLLDQLHHGARYTFVADENLAPELEAFVLSNQMQRPEIGDYLIRSAARFPGTIKAGNTRPIKRGDVLLLNEGYGRYQGELQIALQDMEADPRKNVIGSIRENGDDVLELLRYAPSFELIYDKKRQ